MPTSREGLGPESGDALFAALTRGAAAREESRVLDALVGDWRATTTWEQIPGSGTKHLEGRSENRWIFGGRVLECRGFDADGVESSKLLCAFDPAVGDYTAFAVNAFSASFFLERGDLHDGGSALVLEGLEPAPGERPAIRYRRTFRFDGTDGYTTTITYPDVPVGTYGSFASVHGRIA